MGEYAGLLPRKFISFRCLENKSYELRESITEGTENYPDLHQRSESEVVVTEETETSPTKSLAVLQVAGGKAAAVGETEDASRKCVIVGSQECLLLNSHEGSEGLENFLRGKLESFSVGTLDRIVEVDPTVVLELFDENLVDCGSTRINVVAVDE